MNIATLSAADVSSWYAVTLMERGHEIMFGPFGHVPTGVAALIKDGIDGVLILTDEDENLKEIAARFTRETGRPVWRDLTEIPALTQRQLIVLQPHAIMLVELSVFVCGKIAFAWDEIVLVGLHPCPEALLA